jgi:two-component system response regulator YesN
MTPKSYAKLAQVRIKDWVRYITGHSPFPCWGLTLQLNYDKRLCKQCLFIQMVHLWKEEMVMIKVIVADDEINVCKLICNLVDWSSFDMEILGVAHNGVETLEYVKLYLPDLVVTDIRMPGYDGLEMIAKAREIKPDLDFVIISGYRDFEYAKRAIQFRVQDYILKPIKKDELSSTLQKARNKYITKINNVSSEEQLKLFLQSNMDKQRSGIFNELLLKKPPLDELPLENLNRDYHFHFQSSMFQIFIAKIDCPPQEHYQNVLTVLTDKLVQRLQKALEPHCFDLQLSVEGNRMYGILNLREPGWAPLRRHFKAALDDFLVQASVYGKMALTIGLGDSVTKAGELVLSLSSAEAAVSQRLIEGTGILIEMPLARPDSANNHDINELMSALKSDMEKVLETLDRDQLLVSLENFRSKCLALKNLSGQVLYTIVQNAHSTYLILLCNRYHQIVRLEEQMSGFSEKADQCVSTESLFNLLFTELSEMLVRAMEEAKQSETKPLRLAKQYIQENYTTQVTLEKLAAFIGFNPSYLSTLFKKENGQNFLDYLSEVRITHARAMLKETNKTVATICEEVGYSDLKHFNSIFKKYTGLKPNEYRKLFS